MDAETTVSGSEFQMCEAATGRARPPMVESLKLGTFIQAIAARYREELCSSVLQTH